MEQPQDTFMFIHENDGKDDIEEAHSEVLATVRPGHYIIIYAKAWKRMAIRRQKSLGEYAKKTVIGHVIEILDGMIAKKSDLWKDDVNLLSPEHYANSLPLLIGICEKWITTSAKLGHFPLKGLGVIHPVLDSCIRVVTTTNANQQVSPNSVSPMYIKTGEKETELVVEGPMLYFVRLGMEIASHKCKACLQMRKQRTLYEVYAPYLVSLE